MTTEATGIHIHARPSAGVLATALRFVVAGWPRLLVKREDGAYSVPTTTQPEHYIVSRDGEQILCTCAAGQQSRHCWHVTLVQLLSGLSYYWPLEARLLPFSETEQAAPDEDQTPTAAETEQAIEDPTPAATKKAAKPKTAARKSRAGAVATLAQELMNAGLWYPTEKRLGFNDKPGFGVLASTYTPLAKEHGEQKALQTVAVALAATHDANNGHCSSCTAELRDFASGRASVCWDCGLITPTQEAAVAAA